MTVIARTDSYAIPTIRRGTREEVWWIAIEHRCSVTCLAASVARVT